MGLEPHRDLRQVLARTPSETQAQLNILLKGVKQIRRPQPLSSAVRIEFLHPLKTRSSSPVLVPIRSPRSISSPDLPWALNSMKRSKLNSRVRATTREMSRQLEESHPLIPCLGRRRGCRALSGIRRPGPASTRSVERNRPKALSSYSAAASEATGSSLIHRGRDSIGSHRKFRIFLLTLCQIGKKSLNSSDTASQ